jgi:hypothetical protein
LRPQANGKTFVIDLRLPESQRPIALPTYVIEDGVEWLPLEKAKELYIVERKETHRKPSPIFLAIISVLLLLPPVVVFLKSVKRKRSG